MSKRPKRRAGRVRALGVVAVAVLVTAVSCSSSGSSGPGGPAGTTGNHLETFKVGVLTDLSGLAAANDKSSVDGVKAGTFYAARNGYRIEFVVADTGTNPVMVVTAARKLITQEHVGAVIGASALTYMAAPYLTGRGIPVVGMDSDGPEWVTAKNMFSIVGALNGTKVSDVFGDIMKLEKATNLGSLGYGISPTSAGQTKGFAASAESAGLEVGYLNAQFPFGSTNVAPVALAMKSAGVDSVMTATESNTSLALITALRNQGVDLKAAVLSAGYGGDLLKAGPATLKEAQNVLFAMYAQPFSMQTAATKQMAADLASAGVNTTQASYAQYAGYLSMGLLVEGLKGAGADPDSASLIASLTNFHTWTGMGLFGSVTIDVNNRTGYVTGTGNCIWLARLEGTAFTAVKGADPICGKVVPGKTVSAS